MLDGVVMHRSYALPLLVMLSLVLVARAGRGEEACSGGKTISDATDGHCCWPGQAWDADTNRCFGKPRCPAGMDVDGHACTPALPSLPKPAGSVTDPAPPVWVPPPTRRRAPTVEEQQQAPAPPPSPPPEPVYATVNRVGSGSGTDLPRWPFVFLAGNAMLTIGYITGMFTAIPPASGCTYNSAWAFVPLVGPAVRVADFGPSIQNGNDCTGGNRAPIIATAIASEVLQAGALAAYTVTAVMVFSPKEPKKTSYTLTPGVAGNPLGATLTVVAF